MGKRKIKIESGAEKKGEEEWEREREWEHDCKKGRILLTWWKKMFSIIKQYLTGFSLRP